MTTTLPLNRAAIQPTAEIVPMGGPILQSLTPVGAGNRKGCTPLWARFAARKARR